MKPSKYILTSLLLVAGWLPARAQFHITETWNVGGTISYYTSLAIVPNNAVSGYHANSGALTIHGGTTLQVDDHYVAFGGNSVDSFIGDGSAAWPPVPATKTISGTDQPEFDIAKFMNGAGQIMDITNDQGIMIHQRLDFANGITNTVRSNYWIGSILFSEDATYTNTALGDAQHVNGYVSKQGDDAFTFPVGSGTDLRTLSMSAPDVGTNPMFSVAWIAGDPGTTGDPSNANAMHPRTAVTAPIMSVSAAGQWDWYTGGITGVPMAITVSIPDVSSTGVLAADLRLVGWNGTSWVDLSGTPTASGNTEGSTLTGTIPGNMVDDIQAIGIGSTSVVLPVTFSSFTAQKQGCTALLNWSTDMEYNNNYFAVERSPDGRNFATIAQVTAAGNSTEKKFYTYTDSKPAAGLNQYRIAQVDMDGKRATTSVQALDFNCAQEGVKVYPNPAAHMVNIEAPEGSKIVIYNMIGQRIEVPAISSGHLSILDVSALAAGNYTIHILDASGISSHKLAVVK